MTPLIKYFMENISQKQSNIKNTLIKLKKSYSKLLDTKDIINQLGLLHKKEYPNARVFFFKIRYE